MAYFAQNPILATVTVGSSAFNSKSTNRRFVLTVTIGGVPYKFPHSADNGGSYTIDVSSAYRAALKSAGTPTPSSPTSPTVSGTCTAQGECILDGLVTTVSGISVSGGSVTARLGKYTDIQRMSGTSEAPTILSTKPNLIEVVGTGEVVRLGSSTKTAVAGSQSHVITGRTLYGDDATNHHTMYFLNQYGEVESASVLALESLSVPVNSETVNQVRAPQSASYAKKRSYKTGGQNKWKLSSGYLEREWLSWFAHDFLMSPYHWIKTAQGIIPVIVSAETADIYDKASGELKAVNFTVESTLDGVVELN